MTQCYLYVSTNGKKNSISVSSTWAWSLPHSDMTAAIEYCRVYYRDAQQFLVHSSDQTNLPSSNLFHDSFTSQRPLQLVLIWLVQVPNHWRILNICRFLFMASWQVNTAYMKQFASQYSNTKHKGGVTNRQSNNLHQQLVKIRHFCSLIYGVAGDGYRWIVGREKKLGSQ